DQVVWESGPFQFRTPGIPGSRYEVTVKSQPRSPAQVCAVAGGTGTLDAPVTGIAVACASLPPAGLAYPRLPGRFTLGVAIAAASPSRTGGAVASYSVSPPLPAGLSLDPHTGVLAGMPAAVAPQATYLVTARNEAGTSSVPLVLAVVDFPPTALRYAVGRSDYRAGQPVAPNVPSSAGGAVTSWSVVPPLPAGLALDPGTGAISGTPTASAAATPHTVTATNSGGSTTATISIAVQLYAVGGTVTGVQGSGLVLSTPGQPDLAVPPGAEHFAFPTRVASGASYAIRVVRQPSKPEQVCSVIRGEGAVGLVDVADVSVRCQAVWAAVSGGYSHSVGVRPDGTLWTWGQNALRQLGDGTTTDRRSPRHVGSGYTTAQAGHEHTVAIDAEGNLWAWGENSYGQVGNGTRNPQSTPQPIGSGFASAAAGYFHTVAVAKDGTLWAWGQNAQGQLGDGTTTSRSSPCEIGKGFVAVAAGYQHTLGVKADGTLWAWGWNEHGQLGDGTRDRRLSPVQIGSGFRMVAGGEFHSVALKADGSIWTWGGNAQGQLGDGTTAPRPVPRAVGKGFGAIAAGSLHTVGLMSDGSVWAWGYNFHGQVDAGTGGNQVTPRRVGSGFVSVGAGGSHSLARRSDGTVLAWGNDRNGQLGRVQ
ncbi:MAG: putative Ig domain-containing protein, partial [Deltaproteobacteria bacterium]